MSKIESEVTNRAPTGSYSRAQLVRYGGVTKLTATGTIAGIENVGNPQRRE